MSDKDTHDDQDTRGATPIHAAKSGGNGAKWLLGALAAVLVAGGGYLAWKNMSSAQPGEQSAYNDTYSSSTSSSSAPIEPSNTATENSATQDSAVMAPARTTTVTRRTTTRRTTTVPEETIGLTPVSASSDDVVVQGHRTVWTQIPSGRRLAAFYPENARDSGREGEASLSCTVLDDGKLDCVRVSETPRSGFGYAAMRLSRTLRHAPQFADGRDAAGSALNLHVVFRLADDDRRGRG